MYVYAGIDEAGYGPMYGPLVVARFVLVIPKLSSDAPPPQLWQLLSKAVCKTLRGSKGRLAINDSKKLKTKAAGIKHLEAGVLAFAGLSADKTCRPTDVGQWLDLVSPGIGQSAGAAFDAIPWYAPTADHPWQVLPTAQTADQLAIARSMLASTCKRIGVELGGLGAEVVFEDAFNHRVEQTRSKAAVNFACVAKHLASIFDEYGNDHPHVAVDRQSGRMRYREILAQVFSSATVDVLGETDQRSAYKITQGKRAMSVTFQVDCEQSHMPTALASMTAKYTRELMMQRFNAYFSQVAPNVAPTAGYGTDANRWRDEMLWHLKRARIDHARLRRRA